MFILKSKLVDKAEELKQMFLNGKLSCCFSHITLLKGFIRHLNVLNPTDTSVPDLIFSIVL